LAKACAIATSIGTDCTITTPALITAMAGTAMAGTAMDQAHTAMDPGYSRGLYSRR
jgi:hypothetical protein